jgi:hypothetical protein
MREPTKREQRIDSLYDSLSDRIDEYGLERHDAIHVVEDILFAMITDSDHEFHDHVGAFLHRLYAAGIQVSLRLRDGVQTACVENRGGAEEF